MEIIEDNVSDILDINYDTESVGNYQNNQINRNSFISLFFIFSFTCLIFLQKQIIKNFFSKFIVLNEDKIKYIQVFLISFFNVISVNYVLK